MVAGHVRLVMSSYTVTIVWEFAWADPVLVVLHEWLSYRGGRLNRFDLYIYIYTHTHTHTSFLLISQKS